jgi:hypothetical protein
MALGRGRGSEREKDPAEITNHNRPRRRGPAGLEFGGK